MSEDYRELLFLRSRVGDWGRGEEFREFLFLVFREGGK